MNPTKRKIIHGEARQTQEPPEIKKKEAILHRIVVMQGLNSVTNTFPTLPLHSACIELFFKHTAQHLERIVVHGVFRCFCQMERTLETQRRKEEEKTSHISVGFCCVILCNITVARLLITTSLFPNCKCLLWMFSATIALCPP
jgi:hypothetical protein